MTTRLLHVVADYGPVGDLAWAEVVAALYAKIPGGTQIWPTAVVPLNTMSTGFNVGQLALASSALRPEEVSIFANCAPRKDTAAPRINNAGEGLVFAKLTNGVQILAVNSGYSLSFVRGHLEELRVCRVAADGSQFRSRDNFPDAVGRMLRGELDALLGESLVPEEVIPVLPTNTIVHVDPYGNLKLGIRQGDPLLDELQVGQLVRFTIGGVEQTATYSDGIFGVHNGHLAFAPGSSGQDNRFYELSLRLSSAAAAFGYPEPGTEFSFVSAA